MDVNELLRSLSSQTGQIPDGRSGDSTIAQSTNGDLYVSRRELVELRRSLCELLYLLLNLHVTSEIESEIPYMDIHLN